MHARRINEKASRIEDIVDLTRFPVHLPHDTIAKSLIAECRSSLESKGVYLLRGLLGPEAIEEKHAAFLAVSDRVHSVAVRWV